MSGRLLAAVAMALLFTLPAATQQRFTSRADAVRVDVLVTDGGRRITGLKADDFEVRDNGVVQTITELDVERIPLNVIAVFDVSSSVRGERLQELVAAGRAMVAQLRQTDRIGLVSFATHLSLPVGLTTDHAKVTAAFGTLTGSALTSLRDAVFAALALRETDAARTLALVFSDGDDTSSWLTAARVLDAAKRSDVVVYAVQAPDAVTLRLSYIRDPRTGRIDQVTNPAPLPSDIAAQLKPPHDEHAKFLQNITAETGGTVTQAKTDKDLTPAFTSILGEFRDRYVLSYVPAGVDTPGWHELSVKVRGRSVTVTARRGYVR